MSDSGKITGKDLVRELKDGRCSCIALDDDHYYELDEWAVEEYLDHLLEVFKVSTKSDLEHLFNTIVETCRILARARPVRVKHALPFAKTLVEVGGSIRHHIRHRIPEDCRYTPTEDELENLVARALIGLAEVRKLINLYC